MNKKTLIKTIKKFEFTDGENFYDKDTVMRLYFSEYEVNKDDFDNFTEFLYKAYGFSYVSKWYLITTSGSIGDFSFEQHYYMFDGVIYDDIMAVFLPFSISPQPIAQLSTEAYSEEINSEVINYIKRILFEHI